MPKQANFSVRVLFEKEREPIKRSDLEAALRQVVAHPARSSVVSQYREPSREGLRRGWKMSQR